jgi:hypothetical protein
MPPMSWPDRRVLTSAVGGLRQAGRLALTDTFKDLRRFRGGSDRFKHRVQNSVTDASSHNQTAQFRISESAYDPLVAK